MKVAKWREVTNIHGILWKGREGRRTKLKLSEAQTLIKLSTYNPNANANKRKPNKKIKCVHTMVNTRKNGNKVKRFVFPQRITAVYKTGI